MLRTPVNNRTIYDQDALLEQGAKNSRCRFCSVHFDLKMFLVLVDQLQERLMRLLRSLRKTNT